MNTSSTPSFILKASARITSSVLALIAVAGCTGLSAYNSATSWDIKQTVERNPSPSETCVLKITTSNNTKLTFVGVNTQFVLLDNSGKMVADIRYFVHGTILPGYGLSVARTVTASCKDVAAIRVVYLTLPVPTGYYEPRNLSLEVR